MALWPDQLPQSILLASHSEVDVPAVASFQTSAGPAQLRRMATVAPRNVSCEQIMSLAQSDILNAFYRDTCKMGTLPFEWKNHVTDNVVTYRWKSPPKFTARGSRTPDRTKAMCLMSLELEMLPWTEITGSTPTVPPVAPPIDELLLFQPSDLLSEPAGFSLWEPEPTPIAAPEDPLVLIFSENNVGGEGGFIGTEVQSPSALPGAQAEIADGSTDFTLYHGGFPLITIQ